jgi:hypothetical protein
MNLITGQSGGWLSLLSYGQQATSSCRTRLPCRPRAHRLAGRHWRDPAGVAAGHPEQPTRLLKLFCRACGYTVRTTTKWVAVGLPVCHCGDTLRLNAPPR